ncbi:glutathione S-transferase family protein (plasmid) [Polymorphobacter sp. PAMC 29334]|uniref:glutathione S-transferase family protein n=1 Tax=Polymorphobacter sp. PAMC 29334 TaxID=2862331 RepID=UPI001C671393|nr:glutathione S-transferase family protein [Polymorphobacter sp. PAMC 29334]QYE37081.1 glutathione S-transferase family protein [Polymorphobacter sp. PAMC 29334]
MVMQLFGHPFSSYTWKALIAFYENEIPFEFRNVDPAYPENGAELSRRSAVGKFPLLVDGDDAVFEATAIIEYLAAVHPGPVKLIPADPAAAVKVRMLDRVFDNYVMNVMAVVVGNALRPQEHMDPYGVERARSGLDSIYAWLNGELAGHDWACGTDFTLADCAAAPSLFYADWVHPIGNEHVKLKKYRARLLARPSVARCVDEARPYRAYFPLGAPDRD